MNEIKTRRAGGVPIKKQALAALNEGDKNFPENPAPLLSPENLPAKSEEDAAFEKLFEGSFSSRRFEAGQIVQGTVREIRGDYVIVDIGFKSEGVVSKSEFRLEKDKDSLVPGGAVEVYIESIENESGAVSLSKDKADISKAWRDIIRTAENKETVKGTVTAHVRGGLSVDIGVKAFLPGSQADIRPVRDLKSMIGRTYDFKVIKMNQKRGNIVLSRRVLLEKEKESLAPPAQKIEEGAVLKGVVKNITDYGAFINLGEIDGLLHITDISWQRLKHPSDKLRVGQEITVKALRIDRVKNRVSLGLKQLNDEVWITEAKKAAAQDSVKGRVVKIMDYGAFVALESGLEGLVHINEISWTKKARNPARALEVGQEVRVKVIDVQKESHKLSFSIKRTEKNPWEDIAKIYSVGDILELPVASVSDFGIFLTTKEGIDGLVHASDISWKDSSGFAEKYAVGDKVRVKVLDVNSREGKFSLGIKQLDRNPWDTVEEKYPIGSRHEVTVSHVVDFGVFVRLQENIEGLIHISELSRKRIQNPRDILSAGDRVTAEILSIDSKSRKISLSRRLAEEDEGAPLPPPPRRREEAAGRSKPPFAESSAPEAPLPEAGLPEEARSVAGPPPVADLPEEPPLPPVPPDMHSSQDSVPSPAAARPVADRPDRKDSPAKPQPVAANQGKGKKTAAAKARPLSENKSKASATAKPLSENKSKASATAKPLSENKSKASATAKPPASTAKSPSTTKTAAKPALKKKKEEKDR